MASHKLTFYLFADDTYLLYAYKNLKLETIVNCELFKVVDWLIANKLSLNIKKTNYIIFHPYQKRINYNICIKAYDSRTKTFFDLERKDHVKYLGVIIDQHLSWKHHINYIALKISKNIGVISRLRHFVPLKTLLSIYNSLVSPYISYGLIAWGQASKSYLDKILILQKRSTFCLSERMRFHISLNLTSYQLQCSTSNFHQSECLIKPLTLHLKISAIFLLFHKTYISIVPAQHLLVTTTLIILGSITIKTPFPSLGLKFGTAFPKAIEVYQSTYSKRKFKHYYL